MKDNFRTGARAGLGVAPGASGATATASPAAPAPASPQSASARNGQSAVHGATALAHTMKAGDSHGGGSGPDIKEKD